MPMIVMMANISIIVNPFDDSFNFLKFLPMIDLIIF